MKVEIWSDVICPWCYIGKRRFETALARFPHRREVEVVWRSFELDPRAPAHRPGDLADRIARKYGISRQQALAANASMTRTAAAEGLEYHLDIAQPGNTFDAHRLLHLAAGDGVRRQDALKERLLAAYFVEGAAIAEPDTLLGLAAEAGLDPGRARQVLEGDAFTDAVRGDEEEAMELGITGVPFFLVGRRLAVAGAQTPEVLLGALERGWERAQSAPVAVGGDLSAPDQACTDDRCAT